MGQCFSKGEKVNEANGDNGNRRMGKGYTLETFKG